MILVIKITYAVTSQDVSELDFTMVEYSDYGAGYKITSTTPIKLNRLKKITEYGESISLIFKNDFQVNLKDKTGSSYIYQSDWMTSCDKKENADKLVKALN